MNAGFEISLGRRMRSSLRHDCRPFGESGVADAAFDIDGAESLVSFPLQAAKSVNAPEEDLENI
jgi:hypothetical protein